MAMPRWMLVGALVLAAAAGTAITRSLQRPSIVTLDEAELAEYAGAYQWAPNAFVYLQKWAELSGKNQLVAFDESGEVRTLYPTAADRFFQDRGPRPDAIESRIEFQRDPEAASRHSPGRARAAGTDRAASRHRATRGPAILEWRRSAGRHVDQSDSRGASPRGHSRARLGGRGSEAHSSVCPVSDTPRHGGPGLRQARRR